MRLLPRVCSCEPRVAVADTLWCEAAIDYGEGDGNGGGFARNNIHSRASASACGRLFPPGLAPAGVPHVAGEVELTAVLAAAAAAPLEGMYTHRGDEGDHPWCAVSFPLLEGETFDVDDGDDAAGEHGGLLSVASLRAALSGTLLASLEFRTHSLEDEVVEVAARDSDDPEEDAREAAAWRAVAAALAAAGGRRATFFRPVEGRDGECGCVFPFFALAATPSGSLAGVAGLTVWT